MKSGLITLATLYEVDNTFDSDKFIKLRLRVMHDGTNAKSINFTLESIKNAQESIKNIPILAKVKFDEDDKPDYSGHDTHIEVDYNNKTRLIYDEQPIGLIPEDCNYELKEEYGKNYVYVDGYIWKDYSNYAEDVILSKKEVSLSMEVKYSEVSFNKETNLYDVDGYKYKGITLLGEKHSPAMYKAAASLDNFESKSSEDKMLFIVEQLHECLSNFSQKGGNKVEKEKKNQSEENFEALYSTKMSEARKGISIYKPERGYVHVYDMSDKYVYFKIVEYDEDWDESQEKFYRVEYQFNEEDNTISLNDDTKEEMVLKFITIDENKQIENDRKELFDLRDYKSNNEKEKFEIKAKQVLDKFEEKLSNNEQFKELKNNYQKYSIEDLEKECFALFGSATFSINKEQPSVNVVSTKIQEEKPTKFDDGYGGILEDVYEN